MKGSTCKCDKGWTGGMCQTKIGMWSVKVIDRNSDNDMYMNTIGYDCRHPCDREEQAYKPDCENERLVATKGGCYQHGTCNKDTGDCECNPGWNGIKCNQGM